MLVPGGSTAERPITCVRGSSTIPPLFEPHLHQGIKVCSVPIHLLQVVQPQQTSSNLFEPLQCRESKVCIGLSHGFGVYRTFSNHIFTRESRCVVYLYTCSGWFDRSEPPQTFMNRFDTEKARCVEVYHMRSKWFDYTEPGLSL